MKHNNTLNLIPQLLETEKFILWSETTHIIKAQEVLKKMYESLEDGQFANKHLSHLLLPLEGHTGLNTDFLKGESIISQEHTHVIKSASDCKKIGSKYENSLVVYSFTTKDFNMKHTYISLNQNLTNRLEVHYFQTKKLHRYYGLFYPFCT
jgi:hydrogenase maturation factor